MANNDVRHQQPAYPQHTSSGYIIRKRNVMTSFQISCQRFRKEQTKQLSLLLRRKWSRRRSSDKRTKIALRRNSNYFLWHRCQHFCITFREIVQSRGYENHANNLETRKQEGECTESVKITWNILQFLYTNSEDCTELYDWIWTSLIRTSRRSPLDLVHSVAFNFTVQVKFTRHPSKKVLQVSTCFKVTRFLQIVNVARC